MGGMLLWEKALVVSHLLHGNPFSSQYLLGSVVSFGTIPTKG